MMREIKFRQPVYNKGIFTRFHYWGFISEGNFTSPIPPLDEAKGDSNQYTGLKDKNGKEIYEGDIVHFKDSDNSECVGEINYFNGGFGLENVNGFWRLSSLLGNDCEQDVIGNIYENPELVKGE